MFIGGFQKISLIDYPGKICSIVFTVGCNFRCGYCHNPELVIPKQYPKRIPLDEILSFLLKRKGKIDAITITGGEPTLHPDLANFMRSIKKLGFLIKLDSNGTNPKSLQNIIDNKLINYLAMDIKAPLEKYSNIANVPVDINKIKQSIELVMNSGIPYEFRTTVVKSQLNKNDFLKIGQLIKGSRLYALQKFIPTKANDSRFLKEKTYSDQEFSSLQNIISPFVQQCIVR